MKTSLFKLGLLSLLAIQFAYGDTLCAPLAIFQTPQFPESYRVTLSWLVNATCETDSFEVKLYSSSVQESIMATATLRYQSTSKMLVVPPSIDKEQGLLEGGAPVKVVRHSVDITFKVEDTLGAHFKYVVSIDELNTFEGIIKPLGPADDVKVVFLANMLEGDVSQRGKLIHTALNSIQSFKQHSKLLLVDLTSQSPYVSAQRKLNYLADITQLSANYTYIPIDQNLTSFINQVRGGGGASGEQYFVKQVPVTADSDLILIDTQTVMSQSFKDIVIQKDQLAWLQKEKLRMVYALDKPMYCSGLTEVCMALTGVFRSAYQSLIFDAESKSRPLVIAGGADTYERTYPKHDSNHQEYEDPSNFVDPEFPIHININGPHLLPQEKLMLLSKQQWSAFQRKTYSFGVLTLTTNSSIQTFTQYDINGREIDEVIVEFSSEKDHWYDTYGLYIAYPLCLFFSYAFLHMAYYSFIPRLQEHSQMIQDQIKGVDRPDEEDKSSGSEMDDATTSQDDDDDDNLSGHKPDQPSDNDDEIEETEVPLRIGEEEIEMTEISHRDESSKLDD